MREEKVESIVQNALKDYFKGSIEEIRETDEENISSSGLHSLDQSDLKASQKLFIGGRHSLQKRNSEPHFGQICLLKSGIAEGIEPVKASLSQEANVLRPVTSCEPRVDLELKLDVAFSLPNTQRKEESPEPIICEKATEKIEPEREKNDPFKPAQRRTLSEVSIEAFQAFSDAPEEKELRSSNVSEENRPKVWESPLSKRDNSSRKTSPDCARNGRTFRAMELSPFVTNDRPSSPTPLKSASKSIGKTQKQAPLHAKLGVATAKTEPFERRSPHLDPALGRGRTLLANPLPFRNQRSPEKSHSLSKGSNFPRPSLFDPSNKENRVPSTQPPIETPPIGTRLTLEVPSDSQIPGNNPKLLSNLKKFSMSPGVKSFAFK